MANRKYEMYEYKQILLHMRQGESDRQISKSGLTGRVKAKQLRTLAIKNNWLDPNTKLPTDEDLVKGLETKNKISVHKAAIHEELIKPLVEKGLTALIIYNTLVKEHNYKGHYSSITRYVAELKKLSPNNITIPLHFLPGDSAQVDFGKGPIIFDQDLKQEIHTCFFVMTLCWSRHQYAEIVTNQNLETWLGCHKRAFEWFGGVPSKIIIDNLKAGVIKACYYEPRIQRSYAEFAEGYRFIISTCPPYDPQKKGIVESGVKYVKRNFLPLRNFSGLGDSNIQLKEWCIETAGKRKHGSTFQQPLLQFEQYEKHLLKPLPVSPIEICNWQKVKLHRDCHVRFNKCKYSAPYNLLDKELWLRVSETTVRLYKEHTMVAIHSRKYNPGSISTIPEHLPPNARAYLQQTPEWCLEQAQIIGEQCFKLVAILLSSKIVDYLRAAQGMIKLKSKYGKSKLEAACNRALVFNCPTYNDVKQILAKGLEFEALPLIKDDMQLPNIYLGNSRFYKQDNLTTH